MEQLDKEVDKGLEEESCEIKCLEQILKRLTTFVSLSEMEKINKVIELSDCAIRVAAQLHYLKTGEMPDEIEYSEDDIDYE